MCARHLCVTDRDELSSPAKTVKRTSEVSCFRNPYNACVWRCFLLVVCHAGSLVHGSADRKQALRNGSAAMESRDANCVFMCTCRQSEQHAGVLAV
eukprot:jgi/Antlo1/2147/873